MEELIAKRYVDALLSVSDENEKLIFVDTFNAIAEAMSDAKVHFLINSPMIPTSEKVETLLSLLGSNRGNKLENFIRLLGEQKRLNFIGAIANVLNTNIQKERNRYSGVVKTKNTLSSDKITQLEGTLKRYTGSEITLTQQQSSVDGLRVDIEDLGIEVNFSKERVKEQLIDFIMKSY